MVERLAAGALIAQRYRLSAPLGAGAQATVWEAVDVRRGGALCAIKFSHGPTRQRAEVETLLAIENAHLPRAMDYGRHGDGTFLVLERVAGAPLDARTDPVRALRALADVALALAALHDGGVVHGDVKPANVIVGAERAWLVDLGLASPRGEGIPASGTLAFMPPEALAGDRGPATDLYALGVTGALVLAGRHPLVDDPTDRAKLLAAVAHCDPPRESVIAQLPQYARAAVAALLVPDPERRPSSARAWLARLARDAGEQLLPAQRATALALGPQRVLAAPLVGREVERGAARDALEQTLDGSRSHAGCVLVGPPGAGKRRVLDDAVRALQIAWAARGSLPEIVDELPVEPVRPTVVRRIDAAPLELRALAERIARWNRFSDGSAPAVLAATAAEAPAHPALAEIALGPLDGPALAALLAALGDATPAPSAVEAFRSATGGLAGLAALTAERMDPAAIATASDDDVARALPPSGTASLPPDASPALRACLALLAAAGEPLDEMEIAGALGATGVAATQEAVRRGLALTRGGSVRLAAPLGDEALNAKERAAAGAALEAHLRAHSPGRARARAGAARFRGDREAARVHAEAAASQPGVPAAERARWLAEAAEAAGYPVGYCLRLAAELVTAGEPERALGVLARAPDGPEVLARRAEVLRRAGRAAEARALARTLRDDEDPTARDAARAVLGRDALDRGDPRAALEALGDDAASGPRSLEAGALARLALGDAPAALGLIARAREVSGLDPVQRARLSSLAGMAHQARGEHAVALTAYREAFALASEAGDVDGAATYAVNVGAAELECGALGEAARWISRGARSLAAQGRMADLGRALANLASLRAFLGDRAGAVEQSARAEEAARAAGDAVTESFARMIAAESALSGRRAADALRAAGSALRDAGDEATAGEAFGRAAVALARAGDAREAAQVLALASSGPEALLALARVEIALAEGARAEALDRALEDASRAVALGQTWEYELHALALCVAVAERTGRLDDAQAAREAHRTRVEALAAGVGEGFSTVFRDAHALAAAAPAAVSASTPRGANDARWRRLAEITRELNSEHRLRPLLERVMDAVVELTGAARGFLLLRGPDGVLRVRTARNIGRRDLSGDEMALSRSVAERVARDGEAVLTVDASADGRFDAFESVHAMRLRSILAVPLRVHDGVEGTVYVDDRFRAGAFGDEALEVAREFAEAAAVAIHNARTSAVLRRSLRRSERLSQELKRRVDAQSVELEATRRALSLAPETTGRYDLIVGRGPAMTRTLQLIDKVAPTSMPVLLLGESGTGKELVARAIHANSPRAAKPFVAENCGAIPETLLESVLFGHLRGAFTGADRTRAGLFEVADGGTLFLDEVGEMSPTMQAKLLRVLQDGEIRPLGGARARTVDVRVIAATHRDLSDMVRRGTFREDLYYRLAVMVVPIPALRQRREDLAELVQHFLRKHARRDVTVDRRAMARLLANPWPGNVRQLENEVMRACVLADGVVREEDLSPALLNAPSAGEASSRDPLDLRSAIDDLERQLIERAMRECNGNQSRAARALGLSRFGLQKKLKRLGPLGPARGANGSA